MAFPLILLAVLASGPAGSATRAERLTQRAIDEYGAGELDQALLDAKQAYALQPVPGLLYDLGQIHRALHHWEEAAFSFRAYLRARPDAPNRAAVEEELKQLQKKLAERAAPSPGSPAPSPVSPAPSPGSPPPPPPAVAVPAASLPPPAVHPAPAAAPARRRVSHLAVLDVQPHGGVSADVAQGVTAVVVRVVRSEAVGATVIGADEIRALFGFERQKLLLGCSEASCLAEIGGALGADRVILGSLTRFGDTFVLDLKLVDSRRANVLGEGSARVLQEADLPEGVAQAVDDMFGKAGLPRGPAVEAAVPAPAFAEAPAPRSGHALAWTLFAGSAVAAGFAIYGAVRCAQVQGAINQLSPGAAAVTYEANLGTALGAANAQNWQTGAIVLGAVALGAALGGIFTW